MATTFPVPAGADPTNADDWQPDFDVPGGWYRVLWSPALNEKLWIRASATQYLDGTIETADEDRPSVYLDLDSYTPAEAREMAAALTAAADLADKWAGRG